MLIMVGGKPLRFSQKYQLIYVNLLNQPIVEDITDAELGWIHIGQINKQEAKRIYEAVRRRVLKHQLGKLQSSKTKQGEEVTLSLRRVAAVQ